MKASRIFAVGLTSVVFVSALAPVLAGPEPSPTPVTWELQFSSTRPERISVSGRTYWYVLYTVTNNTPEDVPLHLEIVRVEEIESEVPADKAKQESQKASKITVTPSIVGLDRGVFDAIKRRHEKTHPFLVHPVDAISTLRQGDDNAITSVAVFPEMDPRVSSFTIYVGGLSGEQIVRVNPLFDAKKPANEETNPRVFVMRKTLAMPYTLPGDTRTRKTATPKLGLMEWVMR
ncbi:MAG: hypothetical protein H6819_02520 [Phycisphaerales bacterium]|nr:hypothetical protein [Phycisphaerales bacterium]MCB9856913.1 hypothetical protein [Phycisphaerales bacterium]MCB9861960.1 hypothetical protein [Phycisphaerales bacterium]